jgi:lactate dehydrogenase-like 2-hydroxyacid dehydrogenase
MKKIYVTYEIPQLLALEDRYEIIMNKSGEVMAKEALINAVGEVDAVIAMYDNDFDNEVIDSMKNVKIIASYGAGYNNIDYEHAAQKDIVVSNTPGVLTDVTANLAFGLLMSTARRITESDKCIRSGGFKGWTPEWFVGQEITGKTIGIIGAGLDVFENEPEVEPELLEMDNVVMSAHIGGSTIDTVENMTRICLENIVEVFEGKSAPNKIN